jgi:hypothetical protein
VLEEKKEANLIQMPETASTQYTGDENWLGGKKKKIAHNSTTASAAFLAFLL